MKVMKKLIDKLLEIGAVISIMAMISVVMVQVVSRFALPKAPHWTEEAARMCFIFTISFAGGLAIRDKAFVNVDTFLNLLPKKLSQFIEIMIYIILVGFMGLISLKSLEFIKIGSIQRSPSLLIPMSYLFSSTLIVSLFIGVYSVFELGKSIRAFKEGEDV